MNRFSVVLLIVWLLLGHAGWGQVEIDVKEVQNCPKNLDIICNTSELKGGKEITLKLSSTIKPKDEKIPRWVPEREQKCRLTFTVNSADHFTFLSKAQVFKFKHKRLIYEENPSKKLKDLLHEITTSRTLKFSINTSKEPGNYQIPIAYSSSCASNIKGTITIPFTIKDNSPPADEKPETPNLVEGDDPTGTGNGEPTPGDNHTGSNTSPNEGDNDSGDEDPGDQNDENTYPQHAEEEGTRNTPGPDNGELPDNPTSPSSTPFPITLDPKNASDFLPFPSLLQNELQSDSILNYYLIKKDKTGDYQKFKEVTLGMLAEDGIPVTNINNPPHENVRLVLILKNSGTWQSTNFSFSTTEQKEPESNSTEKPEPESSFLIYLLLGGVFLVLAAILILSGKKHKKEDKKQSIKERSNERQQNLGKELTDLPEQSNEPIDKLGLSKKKAASQPDPDEEPSEEKKTVKPVFKKRTPKASEESAAKGLIASKVFDPQNYVTLSLSEHWADTTVKHVGLRHELMDDIEAFIQEMNIKPFLEDGQDAVPEIGGFILGTYQGTVEEGFEVFLEKFARITPGTSDVYRVSFETQAWAELAQEQDKYPDLETIAWFHTHPGHGLFLSLPDQRIHNGFFQEKYQLAMEIDTLSDGLDMALFSRMQSGTVNNRDQRISESWFKWEKIMKEKSTNE